jgi:tetrahydromethanopterin S-methyltransferase subunit G
MNKLSIPALPLAQEIEETSQRLDQVRAEIVTYTKPEPAQMFALYAIGVVSGIFISLVAFLIIVPAN